MAEYPTNIVEQVHGKLVAGSPARTKVAHYAGEFFDEEQITRIAKDVRQHPYYFVDLEDMIDAGNGSASSRMNTDRLILTVYACASNKRDEPRQQQMSYELANEARKLLVGKEIAGVTGVHSNGFISYVGISKEFQIFGLSVHSLSLHVDITFDLDS